MRAFVETFSETRALNFEHACRGNVFKVGPALFPLKDIPILFL